MSNLKLICSAALFVCVSAQASTPQTCKPARWPYKRTQKVEALVNTFKAAKPEFLTRYLVNELVHPTSDELAFELLEYLKNTTDIETAEGGFIKGLQMASEMTPSSKVPVKVDGAKICAMWDGIQKAYREEKK